MSHRLKAAVAAASVSAFGFAHALTVVPDPLVAGQYSASFEGTHTLASTFADRYEFASPVEGLLTVVLDSATPVGTAGVSFTGYQLDEGPIVSTDAQQVHLVIGPLAVFPGSDVLTLGIVAAPALTARAPATTSYNGTLYIHALPVPEPATWLTMVVGITALASSRRFFKGRDDPQAGSTLPWSAC